MGMELQFIFRKPKFPLMGSINGNFISAKNKISFSEKLSDLQLKSDGFYDFVDTNGEGWSLYVDKMVLSPLTAKKRWTKREIIKMFNDRKNTGCGNQVMYSEKSISTKRLDKIVTEISELAES